MPTIKISSKDLQIMNFKADCPACYKSIIVIGIIKSMGEHNIWIENMDNHVDINYCHHCGNKLKVEIDHDTHAD